MVYETILEGLSKYDTVTHIILSSDGVRSIYNDLNRLLSLIAEYEYFYVVVFHNDKFHVHLLVKDCPFRTAWFDSTWHRIHGCIARHVSVDSVVDTAVYLATNEDYIDFVDCSGGWC